MSGVRRAAWAVAIGVLAVVLATVLFRIRPLSGPLYVVLLVSSVGALSALAALAAEITPRTGAAGGAVAVALVVAVFAATVATAPLEPGARRPGLADVLWTPLLALLAIAGTCALAGFHGVRAGLYLSRKRRQAG